MLTFPSDDPMSIFMNGKLKPGAYGVQNLASQTYLEILEHSRELCCRPAGVLTPKDAVVMSTRSWPWSSQCSQCFNSGTFRRRGQGIESKRCGWLLIVRNLSRRTHRLTWNQVDRGKPDQFCNAPGGLFFGFGSTVSATAFPAAWRIELVDDIQYRGFGYVR